MDQFFVMRIKFSNFADLHCPKQLITTEICSECGGITTNRVNDIVKTAFIGKKEGDYYYDPLLIVHLVSPALLDILKSNSITGFYDQETEFVEWTDRTTGKDLNIDGSKYREIVITGRGGYLTDLSSNRVPHCPKCGKIERFGIYAYDGFSTDAWDGSDMFYLSNWPGVIIVTPKVKKLITKNKFKNISFVPLNEYKFH